jgi:tape measure domain-containing protein
VTSFSAGPTGGKTIFTAAADFSKIVSESKTASTALKGVQTEAEEIGPAAAKGGEEAEGAAASLTERMKALQGQMKDNTESTKQNSRETSGLRDSLTSLGGAVKNVVLYSVVYNGLSAAASYAKTAVFGFNSTLEQSTIAFTTLLGSATAAGSYITQLQQFAKTTPFDFEGLVKNAQLMMGMGIAAKDVIPDLTALGDSAASVGASQDVLNNTILAFSQISAKGTVSMDNMNQLLEGGVPNALKILAAGFHVTTGQMVEMISAGKVSSAQALPLLVTGLEKGTSATAALGGMMDKQSQTFQGALSNIGDGLTQTLAKGFKPFFTTVSNGLQKFAGWLGSPAAASIGDKMSAGITAAMTIISGAFAAVVPYVQQFWSGLNGSGAGTSAMSTLGDIIRTYVVSAFDSLQKIIPAVWTGLQNIWTVVQPLVPILVTIARAVGGWLTQLAALAPVITSVTGFLAKHKTVVDTLVIGILAFIAAYKGMLLMAQAVAAVKGMTAAMKGLNAAMKANMAGIIVAAIIALVAALIYAYKNSKTFRDIVNKTWADVKAIISGAWNDVIKPVFNALVSAGEATWHALQTAWGAIETAWDSVWSAVQTAWNTVGKPIFDVIKIAVGLWVDSVKVLWSIIYLSWYATWQLFKLAWNTVGKPLFDAISAAVKFWWNDLIKPQLDMLQTAWSALWSALQTAWNTVGKPVLDLIVGAAQLWWSSMKFQFDALQTAWGALWTALQVAWSTVGAPIFNAIQTAASAVGDGLRWAYNNVIKPTGDAISAVWSAIKSGWDQMLQGLGAVGNSVLGPIRGAVNDVIGIINGMLHALNHISITLPKVDIPGVGSVGGEHIGFNIGDIPRVALGATILPKRGGTLINVAEAGKAETVVDTGRMNKMIASINARLDNGRQTKLSAAGALGPTPGSMSGVAGLLASSLKGSSGVSAGSVHSVTVGNSIGDVTIINPKPETASDSLARTIRKGGYQKGGPTT